MKYYKHVIIGLFLVGLAALSGCGTKDKKAKHVILISMDTTRADHLSCYGFDKKTTPNIDKFAKDSVLFEQCITPIPYTLPAHSCMMTGTNPVYHGVHDNTSYTLSSENITLAERFQDNAYTAGAIVSTYVLNNKFGMSQGFDTYDDEFRNPKEVFYETERLGDETSQVAIEWLEQHKDENFFLFLHYYDPHDPYRPPQPFASQFADDLYSGEIAFTDFCVKKVFDKLKELKLYDDSLIIIVGDHGEGLGDHGEQQHGYYIYQSSIHVPMIVHFPGGKYKNKRVDKTVGLIDLAPTICRWTGTELLNEYVGKDLTEYLEASPEERFLYSESLAPTQYGCSSLLGLVGNDWKYIQSSAPEMYNIQKEPEELVNCIENETKRARLFQEELKLLLTEQVRKTDIQSSTELDPESRKKLESLGYVSGGKISEDFEFDISKDNPRDWLEVHEKLSKYQGQMKMGLYAEAEQVCLEILDAKPSYIMGYYYLADAQYKLKKYSEAILTAQEFLIKAEEQSSSDSTNDTLRVTSEFISAGHQVIGMSYYESREYDKAIEELNIALNIADENKFAVIYNNLGTAYMAQRKIDLALQFFEKTLEINPEFENAYYNLGLIYTYLKDLDKALSFYKKAVELNPEYGEAKQKYEETSQKIVLKAKMESAIKDLQSELKKTPQNTDVLDKLGGLHQMLGENSEAIAYWERSLTIKANNVTVLNNLAYIHSQSEPLVCNPAKALDYAQKANELTGYQNPNYLDTLALAYASGGDFNRAIETARKALSIALTENNKALVESIQRSIERYQNQSL